MKHNILRMTEGYKDDYKYTRSDQDYEQITVYKESSATGTFVYNESTSLFSAYSEPEHIGMRKYEQATYNVKKQKSSEVFESSMETINISFVGEDIKSNIIKMFVKASISITSLGIDRAVDSNYAYNSTVAEKMLGTPNETARWENTEVKYCGSKQIIIKDLPFETRISDSIKFKFIPQLQIGKLDDIKIHGVEVLHNNSIFIGDDNA